MVKKFVLIVVRFMMKMIIIKNVKLFLNANILPMKTNAKILHAQIISLIINIAIHLVVLNIKLILILIIIRYVLNNAQVILLKKKIKKNVS